MNNPLIPVYPTLLGVILSFVIEFAVAFVIFALLMHYIGRKETKNTRYEKVLLYLVIFLTVYTIMNTIW